MTTKTAERRLDLHAGGVLHGVVERHVGPLAPDFEDAQLGGGGPALEVVAHLKLLEARTLDVVLHLHRFDGARQPDRPGRGVARANQSRTAAFRPSAAGGRRITAARCRHGRAEEDRAES
jgi:hypothetical protein